MANDKKYIKKIKMPVSGESTDLYVKDDEAVSTINSYSNSDINTGTVTFANVAITETEINNLFTASLKEEIK